MFTVAVDVGGAVRKLETLAVSVEDLERPLKIFGDYMKRRAMERYQAQNFEPLAEATVHGRVKKGLASMESKLKGDLNKAVKRSAKRRPPRGLLERVFASGAGRGIDTALGSMSRGAKNRLAVLTEFTQRHRAGKNRMEAAADGKPLTLKMQQSLAVRTMRAVSKKVGKPILGKLPETLEAQVSGAVMTLASRTTRHWTEIHNEGGQAGSGSKIPKRETVTIEDSDLDVLVALLKAHMLLDVQEGMQGPAY
jgi:hypothetical protein